MNLSENLNNSFEFAKKLFRDAGRLIILIVLSFIPLVQWIVFGYAARVLKESPAMDTPPKLENYGELFVNGAKVFFAWLIYMLIPLVLMAAGIVSLFAGLLTLPGGMVTPLVMFGGVGVVLLVVGVILAIILLLLFDVGMAHMVKTGKFGKAFAFGEILEIVGAIGWAKYLGWVVIMFIIWVVVGAIFQIPIIGWIIFFVILPILSVFSFRSMGLLYNDGAPHELRIQPAAMPAALVCPSCGTPLQPQNKFCPNCGAAVPTPPPPPAPPPPSVEATKFCTSCGAKIPASAKFCGSCGAKQT